jgi:hypothetical protein
MGTNFPFDYAGPMPGCQSRNTSNSSSNEKGFMKPGHAHADTMASFIFYAWDFNNCTIAAVADASGLQLSTIRCQ